MPFANIEARRAYAKEYYKEYGVRNRATISRYAKDWNLKRKYGVTRLEYEHMCAVRNNLCDICMGPAQGRDQLVVDHCHLMNRVVGLLCNNCNLAIGLLLEDPNIARRAAEYLESK